MISSKFHRIFFLICAIPVLCISCGDNPSNSFGGTGSAVIVIEHTFNSVPFTFNKEYSLPNGESIKGTMLKYYISNVRLERSDGSIFAMPQDNSYFLIDESIQSSKSLNLIQVPAGTYTYLHFIVGVDSLRSTMGLDKRIGVLDVGAAAQDMYWSWNQGYIHFKLEGSYTSPNGSGDMRYHIGGFGGYSTKTINCVRSVKVDLSGKPCNITSNQSTAVHIGADVQKIFTGKQAISLAINNSVMFAPFATTVADNYATMFTHLVKD